VIPELTILSEGLKRLQEDASLTGRILLFQRYFQFLYQITKPDRVLLVLGMEPMSLLI
jgi:hypothetical protein